MKRILQIVPRLPPAMCGVGDHAHLIAEEMRRGFGIDTQFLVADPEWHDGGAHGGFGFEKIESRSPVAAASQIQRAAADCGAVVVQYSGYGFSKRGAPLWLLKALKRFRAACPRIPLITMVHELYADGPLYRSSFWFSLLQRYITRSLARLSDELRTNRTASARWLEEAAPAHRGRVIVKPVFSNLGECSGLPAPSKRDRRLVLFGHQFADARDFWPRLHEIAQSLKATHVVILTRPLKAPASWPREITVESHGILSAAEISAIMRDCRWGLINYPGAFLGKSGVIATLFAHGIVPILFNEETTLSEGLKTGEHVFTPAMTRWIDDDEALDRASAQGISWYSDHDLPSYAASYASRLTAGEPAPAR